MSSRPKGPQARTRGSLGPKTSIFHIELVRFPNPLGRNRSTTMLYIEPEANISKVLHVSKLSVRFLLVTHSYVTGNGRGKRRFTLFQCGGTWVTHSKGSESTRGARRFTLSDSQCDRKSSLKISCALELVVN